MGGKPERTEDGYLLVLCLVMVSVLSLIGLSIGQFLAAKYASTKQGVYSTSAVMVAEAGLSDTIARLTADPAFTGYTTRKQFFSNATQGKGEYSSTVTSPTSTTREIRVTGYVYRNPDSTANEVKKTITSIIKAQVSPKKYSVFAGSGGLTVGQFVAIRAGNIYVQGKVGIDFGGSLGTFGSPVDLTVGNLACRTGGAGSQYPVQCPVGDQPLSIAWLSSIYGSVCATGQTSKSQIYPGIIGEGLDEGCVAESGSMPAFDKQGFVNGMTLPAKQPNSGNCSGFGNSTTWEAGTIFDSTMNFNSVCKVTVKGNVYIKGDLTSNLFVHFNVDESVTTPPVIVVNGTASLNFSRVSANSAGVPMRIISFKSSNPGCSNSDNCVALPSYDDVYNSTSVTGTSCLGTPHGDMPGLIMQAYFAKANIGLGCSLGSVAGQAVHFSFFSGTSLLGQLSLDGTITIDGWKVVDYQQTY